MTKITIQFFVILFSVYLTEQATFLEQSYIDSINKVATTWTAGVNFDPKTSKEFILRLLGSKKYGMVTSSIGRKKTNDLIYGNGSKTRKYFDARKHWRHCKTIGTVRDQGKCGTCWAFASTGAFADRLCIATNGNFNQLLSVEELAFCCHTCGEGCNGGEPIKAWEYFRKHGVVTGGNYNTSDGCQPYKIKPCLHHQEGEGSCDSQSDPPRQTCADYCYGDETIDFKSDHRKTRNAYYLTADSIQKDVEIYGPVVASFDVYDDFFHYKKGVYQKTENATHVGAHDVKLIGWGVEHGTDYWLIVNSWGTSWGDNGLFKIRRGTNECGIDDSATGGVPLV